MGKALLVVIVVVLAVYSLFDVMAAPKRQIRMLPRLLWLVVVLIPVAGALLWLAFGKARQDSSPPPPPPRPHRPTPRGPDDDPDFLRGL